MHRPTFRRFALGACRLLLLSFAALAAVGCSRDERRTVHGSVFFNGQPLSSCVVRFHGAGDHLTTALTQTDGSFSITDVLPGEVKVTVAPMFQGTARGTPPEEAPRGQPRPKPSKSTSIPAKYQSVTTTDLVYTITPQTDDIKIDLK